MRPYFQHLHSANKYLLVLFGFCIPVSTALTNVVLGLLVLCWLLDNGANRFARWGRVWMKCYRLFFLSALSGSAIATPPK